MILEPFAPSCTTFSNLDASHYITLYILLDSFLYLKIYSFQYTLKYQNQHILKVQYNDKKN